MKKKPKQEYPPGWDEKRVREVIDYYENQTDEEHLAEIEAALKSENITNLEEVTEPVFVRRNEIQVRLPARAAAAVRKLAHAHGVTEEELVRSWITEHIAPRNGHRSKKRPSASKSRK